MKYTLSQPATSDPAPALARGLALLNLLHRQGACSLEQIAQECNWPKSSVLRLLQSLMAFGAVGRDPETLAFRAIQRLVPINSEDQQLREHCATAIARLCDQSGHTVELHRVDASGTEMIDRQEPDQAVICVVARVGWRQSLSEFDAINQVRLVFGSNAPMDVATMWHWQDGRKTALDPQRMEQVVKHVRQSHAAVDLDMNSNGVRRYASPLLDSESRLRGILVIAQACTPHCHKVNTDFNRWLTAAAHLLSESLAPTRIDHC